MAKKIKDGSHAEPSYPIESIAELLALPFDKAPPDGEPPAPGFTEALEGAFSSDSMMRGLLTRRIRETEDGKPHVEYVIGFGGTQNVVELIRNIPPYLTDHLPEQYSEAHHFYHLCRDAIAREINTMIPEHRENMEFSITVYGHSMGGLMAQMVSEGDMQVGDVTLRERVVAIDSPPPSEFLDNAEFKLESHLNADGVEALKARTLAVLVSLGGTGDAINAYKGRQIADEVLVVDAPSLGFPPIPLYTVQSCLAHMGGAIIKQLEQGHYTLTSSEGLYNGELNYKWPESYGEGIASYRANFVGMLRERVEGVAQQLQNLLGNDPNEPPTTPSPIYRGTYQGMVDAQRAPAPVSIQPGRR